jgi:hypothetical protein
MRASRRWRSFAADLDRPPGTILGGEEGLDEGVEEVALGAVPKPQTLALILTGAGLLFLARPRRELSRALLHQNLILTIA